MHAVLDSPGPTQGRPLMILVSGFTYDHQYWDPAVGGGKYSFVDAANRAGYATLISTGWAWDRVTIRRRN